MLEEKIDNNFVNRYSVADRSRLTVQGAFPIGGDVIRFERGTVSHIWD